MEKMKVIVQCLLLKNNVVIISEIVEVGSELGEPDCKLINPYLYSEDGSMVRWNYHITEQKEFMIHSDSILTIMKPNEDIIKKYFELIS